MKKKKLPVDRRVLEAVLVVARVPVVVHSRATLAPKPTTHGRHAKRVLRHAHVFVPVLLGFFPLVSQLGVVLNEVNEILGLLANVDALMLN